MFDPFGLFDFDGDGETDVFEQTMGFIIADDILNEEKRLNDDDDDFDDDFNEEVDW